MEATIQCAVDIEHGETVSVRVRGNEETIPAPAPSEPLDPRVTHSGVFPIKLARSPDGNQAGLPALWDIVDDEMPTTRFRVSR